MVHRSTARAMHLAMAAALIATVGAAHTNNRKERNVLNLINQEPATEDIPVSSSPCSGNGRLVNGSCLCDKGYGWAGFKPDPFETCADFTLDKCPGMCSGHGRCILQDGAPTCACKPSYEGSACDVYRPCETLEHCSSHGACVKGKCACRTGWQREDCSEPIDECPNQCSGHGQCRFDLPGFVGERHCRCRTGYVGLDCSRATSKCPNGCSGQGICYLDVNGTGTCGCRIGFAGASCAAISDPCGGCAHGLCVDGTCNCFGAWTGFHCDVYNASLDAGCKELNFCSGHGVCATNLDGSGATCVCFDMFGGDTCDRLEGVDASCPGHCNGRGTCHYGACVCKPGWTGPGCEKSRCKVDLNNEKVCGGRGLCVDMANDVWGCKCTSPSANGPLGTCESNLCPQACSGHGVCRKDLTCNCTGGYTGTACDLPPIEHEIPIFPELVSPSPEPVPVKHHLRNSTSRNFNNTGSGVGLVVDPNNAHEAATESEVATSQPGSIATATDDPDAVKEDIDPPCLNDCSGHGACHEGVCFCTGGYSGTDCSFAPDTEDADTDDDDTNDDTGVEFLLQTMEGIGDHSSTSVVGDAERSMAALFD